MWFFKGHAYPITKKLYNNLTYELFIDFSFLYILLILEIELTNKEHVLCVFIESDLQTPLLDHMMYEFWMTIYPSLVCDENIEYCILKNDDELCQSKFIDKKIVMYKILGFNQTINGFWATLFPS
jgi:hypothetical protein